MRAMVGRSPQQVPCRMFDRALTDAPVTRSASRGLKPYRANFVSERQGKSGRCHEHDALGLSSSCSL